MKRKCVLLYGPTLYKDKELQRKLRQSYSLITEQDETQIEKMLKSHKVDLLLMELENDKTEIVDLINDTKVRLPGIQIVVINGNQSLISKAFQNGVKDAFRKPYKVELVLERISILIE